MADLVIQEYTSTNFNSSPYHVGNISENLHMEHHNSTIVKKLNTEMNWQWVQIAVPVISLFGVLGNVLNLVVLTRRRMVAGMDRLGRTANYGLIALAVSDLLFCLTVFPHTFITTSGASSAVDRYYRLYGIAAINLFIMVSTWLIVSMAVKRYIVVVYPLHAREQLTVRRTVLVILGVYVISLLLTLPYFLHFSVVATCDSSAPYKFQRVWSKTTTKILLFYIRWIWPIIADFIPIVLLVFCNVRLIRELRGASLIRQSSCPGQRVKDTNHRVTLTLVIIVLMLLVLVSPAEVLKYINPYESWGYVGHIVASVANMMQTVNFSLNFLLYFAVNAKFRQTVRTLLPNSFNTSLPGNSEFSRVFSRSSRLDAETDGL